MGPGPRGGERRSQTTQEKCGVGVVLASRAARGRGGALNGREPLHHHPPRDQISTHTGPSAPEHALHCGRTGLLLPGSGPLFRNSLQPPPLHPRETHTAGLLQVHPNTLACAPHIRPPLPNSGFSLPEASHSPSPRRALLLLCSFKSCLRPVLWLPVLPASGCPSHPTHSVSFAVAL